MKIISKIILILFFNTFLANNVFALSLDFDYPKEVDFDEEFIVQINSDSNKVYDVKIFVHNSSDEKVSRGEIVSLIFNEEKWKDPWNYLLSSYPEKKEYQLKVSESFGDFTICVQFREPQKSVIEAKTCNPIEVKELDFVKDEHKKEENKISVKEDNVINKSNKKQETNTTLINSNVVFENNDNLIVNQNEEKISLKSSNLKKENNTFITKEEKIRLYAVYAFAFFSLIIIIFLYFKRL